jgi:hypothetical protein
LPHAERLRAGAAEIVCSAHRELSAIRWLNLDPGKIAGVFWWGKDPVTNEEIMTKH